MPAPGDQHKANGTTDANPFEEAKPHISEYTAQEIATLQSRLNKRLGPEYIATRAGPGGKKVAYLSAEKAINLANEVFGFNGWSSSIQNIQIDFVDENVQTQKISIGLSVVVRVTLRDGTYHEDIGYGGIENAKGKIAAFEKAKKEGTTDALKRALRNFGNVLGNCIYDHDYIAKVSKVKTGTGKWDVNDLHRHADYVVKKEEGPVKTIAPPSLPTATSLELDESFDVAEFDDNDFDDFAHPDEMLLPTESANHSGRTGQQMRPPPKNSITPSKPPQIRQPMQNNGMVAPNSHYPPSSHAVDSKTSISNTNTNGQQHHSPNVTSHHFAQPQQRTGSAPTPSQLAGGFYSARAADKLDESNNPLDNQAVKFNPHAESPSIRKTTGVDHSKSVALNRHTLKPELLPPREQSSDVKFDASRKPVIPGQNMPNTAITRGMSTSQYRPPVVNRAGATSVPNSTSTSVGPGDRPLQAAKRAPLSDLSNAPQQQQHNATSVTVDGADAKRQKVGGPMPTANQVSGVENTNSAAVASGGGGNTGGQVRTSGP